MSLSKNTITKQPSEVKLCSMSFANKMTGAEEIFSIVSIEQSYLSSGVTSIDLDFTNQTFSGMVAQFLVGGGVVPARNDKKETDYKVTVKVTTTFNQELENDGILKVKEE